MGDLAAARDPHQNLGSARTSEGMRHSDDAVLFTLGKSFLDLDGRSALGAGKPYALLVYLALSPNRVVARDELLDLLWANLDPERGRATLRQTLFHLRSQLGESALANEGSALRLSVELRVDAIQFAELIASQRVDDALSLYAGSFLDGIALPGGSEFEKWAAVERARLSGLHVRAAESSVRRWLDLGRFAEAIERARSLRDAEPFRQSAWRLLLESHEAAGQLTAATIEAQALDSFLAREGLDAEPATVARLQGIRSHPAPPLRVNARILSPEMVGREHDFAVLLGRFTAARTGTPAHVHVRGETGLGKTRLLTDFAARLRADRRQCLAVRAYRGEASIPFALLADLVTSLASLPGALAISRASAETLVELSPGLSSVFRDTGGPKAAASAEELFRLRVLALAELVSVVADEAPLALLVDDLQWADDESRTAIAGAWRRFRGPVMLLSASRDADPIGEDGSTQIALKPLSDEALRGLVMSLGIELDAAQLARLALALATCCDGNPFLIVQSLELAVEGGVLIPSGELLRCVNADALVRLVEAGSGLASRIESLDAGSRVVLFAISAAEIPVSTPVAAEASGLPPDQAVRLIGELVDRRLVADASGGWRPAHDRIGEAAIRRESELELRSVRIRVAMALARSPDVDAYRAAARMLIDSGADAELTIVVRSWLRARRSAGDRRPARRLLTTMLGNDSVRRHHRALRDALPRRERVPLRTVLSAIVIIGVLAVSAAFWRRPSARMYVVQAPSIAARTVEGSRAVLLPAPAVEVRTASGARDAQRDSVVIRVVRGAGVLRGDTTVPLTDGRAVFPDVHLIGKGPFTLGFRARNSGASAEVAFDAAARDWSTGKLRLVSARFKRQFITSTNAVLHVAAGTQVSGLVTVEYNTTFPDATVWYAATPTWGAPARVYQSFGALSTPARDRIRTDPVSFTTPRVPGTWLYILAMGPEPNAEYLLSGTNWAFGKPDWGDGNELATTDRALLEAGLKSGWVGETRLRRDGGRTSYSPGRIAITGFRVQVDGPH